MEYIIAAAILIAFGGFIYARMRGPDNRGGGVIDPPITRGLWERFWNGE